MVRNLENLDIIDTVAMMVALLYTIVSHELAHGAVAYANGDPTAKEAGRLTLNPIPHISWTGLVSLLIFRFGWAKPVPINPYRFRKRRVGLLTTSLAGVMTNLISAFIALFLLSHFYGHYLLIDRLFTYIAIYGVSFAVFNLIPIPPLDGSKVVMSFLPDDWTNWISQRERYFNYLLLALVFTGVLSKFMIPIIDRIFSFMMSLFMGV